jgi:ketosteroid isomerase-like protein
MTDPEITDEDLTELVARVREATGALIQGDVRRYLALVPSTQDYTLMPPTGGETRHGLDSSAASIEALETFFTGEGGGDFELEQSYVSGDLAVLVGVERQHGSVGGLPDQDWSLRVTLVFRREDSEWRLAHRHADALVHSVSMEQLSLLAHGSGLSD